MHRRPSDPLPQAMARGVRRYCPQTASFLANCAALAYGAPRAAESALRCVDAFEGFAPFDRAGTQGYVARFKSCDVIAFRGTERDRRDILTDLDFWPEPVGDLGGMVHGGFLAAFNAVRADIFREVDQTSLCKPVYFTGHSLGGALAVIAAAALSGPMVSPAARLTVYSFGAPRVGNRAFVQRLGRFARVPHYRHTNAADIVPWVPPLTLLFRHGGGHIHLTADGRALKAASPVRHLASLIAAVLPGLCKAGGWQGGLPLRLFTDHRIDEYRTKLWGLAHG